MTVIATAMTVPLLFLAGPAQAQPPEDGGSHRVERQDRDKDRAGRHTERDHAKAERDTEGKQAKPAKQARSERDSEGKQAKAERDTEGEPAKAERDTEGKQSKAEREADREQRRDTRDDKGSAGGGNRPAQPADSDKDAAADDPLEMPLLAPPTSEPIPRPTPADTNDPAEDPGTSDDGNQAAESPPAPAGTAPEAGPAAPAELAAPVAEPDEATVSDPEPATVGAPIASLWPIDGPSVGSVVVAAPDVPRTFPGVITEDTPISDAVPLLLIVLGVFLAVQRGIGHGLGHVPMSGAVGRDRHGRD